MTFNSNNQVERELGWDDLITQDAKEFITLPIGDYDFTVKGFERSRFDGSAKMPSCPMAIVKLGITDPQSGQEVTVEHRMFLHTKTEWTISQFFTSLGLKKKGEPLKPNWQAIIGMQGSLKLGHRLHDGNTFHDVKEFYAKEENVSSGGYSF